MSKEAKNQTEETKEEIVQASRKKNNKLKWYIVTAISGREKSVANLLKTRIRTSELDNKITEVFIPTQEKVIIKGGKKETVDEKLFPGYILVQMEVNDETLHLVRNTEGVQGFLGAQTNVKKPTPLRDEQVKGIMAFTKVQNKPTYQAKFSVNDTVKVEQGAFKDFIGTVQAINESKGQLTVLLSIFGRETPVQIDDFSHVSKI